MRRISSKSSKKDPARELSIRTNTYPELVLATAKLSIANPSVMLFYRGQSSDFQNREGTTILYPRIYRSDYLTHDEVIARFEVLESASEDLVNSLSIKSSQSIDDIRRRKFVRWAILQHYEVCPTPFLDVTHSLHVACSFATNDNNNDFGYVYVLGLPFLASRIGMDAEEELVNVRLLSICPSEALRPHFQEGYVIGTLDVTSEYEEKTELDFARRLIAKFEIPTTEEFWTDGFGPIPNRILFPDDDDIVYRDISELKELSRRMARPGDIGRFIEKWAKFEAGLRNQRVLEPKYAASVGTIIQSLVKTGAIDKKLSSRIENLRTFRNKLVHRTREVEEVEIVNAIELLESTMELLNISQ